MVQTRFRTVAILCFMCVYGNPVIQNKQQKGCTVNKRWLNDMSLWSNSHTTVKQQEKIKLSKTQPRLYPQQFWPLVYTDTQYNIVYQNRQGIGMRTESALLYKSDSYSLIWYCRCWLHICISAIQSLTVLWHYK